MPDIAENKSKEPIERKSSWPDNYPLEDGMSPAESLAFIDSQLRADPTDAEPTDKSPSTPVPRTMTADRAAMIVKMRKAL